MESRRNFVKKTAIIGTGLALAPSLTFGINTNSKDRLTGQTHTFIFQN